MKAYPEMTNNYIAAPLTGFLVITASGRIKNRDPETKLPEGPQSRYGQHLIRHDRLKATGQGELHGIYSTRPADGWTLPKK
jgi:hypothetical protein